MHLSPHDCDLLLAELVPKDRAAELRGHAEGCAECGARLREAEATRAAFLVKNPPAARTHKLLAELGARPARPRRWLWGLGSALPVAAALLLLLRPSGPPHGTTTTRLKGEALSCRLLRGGQVVALLEADQRAPAQAGDSLTCTAAPPTDAPHLEVWGADGATPPQRLYTADLSGPSEVPRGSAFAVSGHGEMRLYFMWSSRQLPDAPISARLANLPDRPSIAGARIEWLGVLAH